VCVVRCHGRGLAAEKSTLERVIARGSSERVIERVIDDVARITTIYGSTYTKINLGEA
jgi:hypothetical protein